jgi:hypothetical protein
MSRRRVSRGNRRWVLKDIRQRKCVYHMKVSICVFYMCMWVSMETITYVCGFVERHLRRPQKAHCSRAARHNRLGQVCL